MRKIVFLLLLISTFSCAQKKEPILGETEFQKKMNSEFKDASTSPLKTKDLKKFKGLEFFKFDSAYVVKAILKRTPNEKPFEMKTTTSRLPRYVKYAVLEFELKEESFKLDIFQNLNLMDDPEYVDYLFLPFLDETNGESSYGGGRYIELRIPEGDEILIDFNKAYNPYCAYNEKYSCPIVPRQNYLRTKVEAGVKAFKKH
jgi:uncharacterized protein (DUF1684 family)